MITLLKKAIARETEFIAHCKTSDQRDNPQVIEMRLESQGRLAGFEAALSACRGSFCELRIWAGD